MIGVYLQGLALGLVLSILAYALLRRKERYPDLPFDADQRPWVLVVRSDRPGYKAMMFSLRFYANKYGIDVREVSEGEAPVPIPGGVFFQGRYFWFSPATYSPGLIKHNFERAALAWRRYLSGWYRKFSSSVVVHSPAPYSTFDVSFDTYSSKKILAPGEYSLGEGELHTDYIGVSYSPYFEEFLGFTGSGVVDVSQLAPYREYIYVRTPVVSTEVV